MRVSPRSVSLRRHFKHFKTCIPTWEIRGRARACVYRARCPKNIYRVGIPLHRWRWWCPRWQRRRRRRRADGLLGGSGKGSYGKVVRFEIGQRARLRSKRMPKRMHAAEDRDTCQVTWARRRGCPLLRRAATGTCTAAAAHLWTSQTRNEVWPGGAGERWRS